MLGWHMRRTLKLSKRMAIAFKKPPCDLTLAVLPKVRERQDVVDALSDAAKTAGITESEALRQLLNAYLAQPFHMGQASKGNLDGTLAPCRVSNALLVGVQRHARYAGVSVSELIRQVVRKQVGAEC